MNRVPALLLSLTLVALVSAAANAGETAPTTHTQPHMMYFYNPSCRLCTSTNEVVAKVEEKFKDSMSFQRFDIADQETGADDVMYMFDLMDELSVPESDNTTLVVFLGILEEVGEEIYFTPKRVLVDGENIIEKLDAEITSFLANEGAVALDAKGGKSGTADFFPAA